MRSKYNMIKTRGGSDEMSAKMKGVCVKEA
jgi:hypothetical protein